MHSSTILIKILLKRHLISYVQCFLLILFKWLIDKLLLYVTSKLFQYSKTLHTILNNDECNCYILKNTGVILHPPPNKKTPQKTPKNSKQPAHILNNDHRKCVTITFYKMYIYILTFMVKDMPCFTTEKINSPVWKTCTASEPKYNNGIYLNIYFNCYEKWHDVRPTLFSGPLLTGDKWGE